MRRVLFGLHAGFLTAISVAFVLYVMIIWDDPWRSCWDVFFWSTSMFILVCGLAIVSTRVYYREKKRWGIE